MTTCLITNCPIQVRFSLQAFVSFLYSDRVTLCTSGKVLERLLVLGEKYEIAGLKTIAENRLMNRVRKENSARYLALADMHHAAELKGKAMQVVVSNLPEVRKTKDWDLICPDLKDCILEEIANNYKIIKKHKKKNVRGVDLT